MSFLRLFGTFLYLGSFRVIEGHLGVIGDYALHEQKQTQDQEVQVHFLNAKSLVVKVIWILRVIRLLVN